MRLLVIDDEESVRKTTALALEEMGHQAVGVATGAAALGQMEKAHFEVAFLDLRLDGEDGLQLLTDMLKSYPRLDVVVFTAFATIENAVDAMRRGAVDYIPKPFTPEQIRRALARIVKARRLEGRLAELESRISHDWPAEDLTTAEPNMAAVLQVGFKAAVTPATILILGESGTGKGVLARALHARSAQKENAFVTVNCPSLSRELLESELFGHVKGAFTGAIGETWGKVALAEGGTLLLDEIGDLPLEIQPKLLRLLQEREYERVGEAKPRQANVRVIATTNRNLEHGVKEGRFREDLYYRLNVISLRLLPLRERKADLLRMANGYLRFFAAQCGKVIQAFSPEAQRAMLQYDWPGNLRELRNLVERAAILSSGSQIELADLPEKLIPSPDHNPVAKLQVGARVSLEQLANEHIRQIMQEATTMEEAARILGIDPATLYRKRKKFVS